MRSLRTALGMVALLVVAAPPSVGQVLEGPDGPVEFVGLKEWSASDLFDAIRELAPDQPFHACAAVMEMELGFAEAAAMSYRTVGSDDVYTVVVGVEDSAHVRPRAIGSETLPLPDTWQTLKTVAEEDPYTLTSAARTLHSRDDAEWIGADPDALAEVWALIDGASSQEDRRFARELGPSTWFCGFWLPPKSIRSSGGSWLENGRTFCWRMPAPNTAGRRHRPSPS
ncbi:hypothetical protein [Candidatus Palauibacter sp.]|uniref:hypothetical protein n=1 Tax=Candidatus Palauibacter sp. TaxID=3101350 RepID=UPI003B01CD44